MPTNGHGIAHILQARQDIVLDLTFSGAHIWNRAKGKDCISRRYIVSAGCLNDGTQHFNLRAKREAKKKKKKETCKTWFYPPRLFPLLYFILITILSSLRQGLGMSCAPSMPQHHVGTDLLNLSPPSPNTSHFPIPSTYMCYVAKRALGSPTWPIGPAWYIVPCLKRDIRLTTLYSAWHLLELKLVMAVY